MCVTVAQWSKKLVARADITGSTPDDAVFLFCFVFSFLFFNTIFLFGLFSFVLIADSVDHALGSRYILSLRPEFYFGKGISRTLDLHTGQVYGQKKP